MRKFKYAPEPIPPLTPEQWEFLEKEMNKPLTKKQRALWKRAKKVYDTINKNSGKTPLEEK